MISSEQGSALPAVALVGMGYWGRNLARNFAELGALHTVIDPAEASRSEVAARWPAVRATADIDVALADDAIDGLVVAAPAELHAPLAQRAIEAGKHVFVEKPLALTVADGEALLAAAEAAGTTLMVGHLLEYHPAVLELERLIRAETIGPVRRIYSNRLSWGLMRSEENVLWSFAPHDLSVILRLVGRPPRRVLCLGDAWVQPAIEDAAVLHLDFGDDLGAHVFVSWQHPHKEQRLVVNGAHGVLVFEDSAPPERKLVRYHHAVEHTGGRPVARKGEVTALPFPASEPLKQECRAFLDAIATGAAPPTDGASALRVLRVLEAAQRSMDRGGEWVELATKAG